MPRPTNPDLTKAWKIHVPATLAGVVERMLLDPIHSRPLYGARSELLTNLLEHWVDVQEGRKPRPLLTIEQLRNINV